MEKDQPLPLYEPPTARDLSGGGISGQDPLGWCSHGGHPTLAGMGAKCKNGSMVSDACKGGGGNY